MSTDSLSLNELESAPYVKFERVGDKVRGRITSVRRAPQTDFDTGETLTWSNGDPRMQTLIVLDVDGEQRTLYARGGKFEAETGTGTSMEGAIVAAVRAAGADAIQPGAELAVEHSGLSKRVGSKFPAKLYTAQYRPPAPASVPVDDLFSS